MKMIEDDKKRLVGQKVYIELKSGRKYNGSIQNIISQKVKLIDKYGDLVMFTIDDISIIEVKHEK